MEGQPSREHREPKEIKFVPAELSVVEPNSIHNSFGIQYTAIDPIQCELYNYAIKKIADENNLRPFHQSGSFEKQGWQYFEFWATTNKEAVTELFQAIHKKAKEDFDVMKQDGMFE